MQSYAGITVKVRFKSDISTHRFIFTSTALRRTAFQPVRHRAAEQVCVALELRQRRAHGVVELVTVTAIAFANVVGIVRRSQALRTHD
jgi:hypothetical protein